MAALASLDCAGDFGPFDGVTWLNCSHQGPLPQAAAEAAHDAVRWKTAPHRLTSALFAEVPARLRRALAALVGSRPEEIVLANSASYGLHLVANGLPLEEGDEVLVVRGDFPSVILPWLGLESRGVVVTAVDPGENGLDTERLARHVSARTRVLCTTWVHSFTGRALDLDALGSFCRQHGIRFIVNGAQAVGARPIVVSTSPIDALVSVGFKWLCGPYGTGFCWLRPELLDELRVNQTYWLSMQTADDLGREEALPSIRDDLGASRYDVFGTANFFNYVPWTVAIEYLLDIGIDRIEAHDADLVHELIRGLEDRGFVVSSPRDGSERSTIVIATHPDRSKNASLREELQERGIEVAYRRGNLRFSPHLYNTRDDIARALGMLDELG